MNRAVEKRKKEKKKNEGREYQKKCFRNNSDVLKTEKNLKCICHANGIFIEKCKCIDWNKFLEKEAINDVI